MVFKSEDFFTLSALHLILLIQKYLSTVRVTYLLKFLYTYIQFYSENNATVS